ncbi:hypothetical protein NECID01_0836 [Nematocida sp. AWRm77]|nr:hypothetical protein NECID01_0836 [Nematocida sp. AWRm77]
MEKVIAGNALATDGQVSATIVRRVCEMDEASLEALLSSLYTHKGASKKTKQQMGTAVWERLSQKKDSLFLTIRMAKCLSVLIDKATPAMVAFFEEALEEAAKKHAAERQESFLWANQVLDLGIKLAQTKETRAAMQKASFFQAVQKCLEVCPHKAVVLLIRLIDEHMLCHIAREPLNDLHRKSTGPLKEAVEVLMAYIEGYTLQKTAKTPEDPGEKRISLPWDKRRMGHFPLQSLNLKFLIDSLMAQRSKPLALMGLGFLIESSPSVVQYLEEMGDIQRIVKETLLLAGVEKLRMEWFLITILSQKGKAHIILAEEGYIEHIMKSLEKKLDQEILDGEVCSGLSILRLLARHLKIITLYMCGNQLVNIVEKIVVILHRVYTRDKYPEIQKTAEQYLFFIGNLVLLSPEWKEISIERIVPYLVPLLEERAFALYTLQFLKMLLYECTEDIVQKSLECVPFSFLTKRTWGSEEVLEFYKVVQNMVCTGSKVQEIQEVVEWTVSEFCSVGARIQEKSTGSGIEEQDIAQVSGFLSIISNITVLYKEQECTEEVLSTVITLAGISNTFTSKLIWYITNIIWEKGEELSHTRCVQLIALLNTKIGQEKDLDERLKQLVFLLKSILVNQTNAPTHETANQDSASQDSVAQEAVSQEAVAHETSSSHEAVSQ